MRILHTSDWHLGKHLEMHSRLPEQEEFIDEMEQICEERSVDLILLAGDVYDNSNPPAEAEQLFYSACLRLSKKGKRPIAVISGNHDSPERMRAAASLAALSGVVIIDSQGSKAAIGEYDGFSILDSDEGMLELLVNGEKAIIAVVPFPSEKRLNEIFTAPGHEEQIRKSYSEKVEEIFAALSAKFRDDAVNLAMGHFYINGGESSGSEREIQLGGSYAVEPKALPEKAQYIAMGHLHRPQAVAGLKNAFYSGSPIQYSKSETGYAKSVIIVDVHPGKEPAFEKVHLRNYKPVEVWKLGSIEEAIAECEARGAENSWVFLEVKTDRPLTPSEMKLMKSAKRDIVEINPIMDSVDADAGNSSEEKTIAEEFADFYLSLRGAAPSEELIELFLSISGEEDDR
ncbi:MAG: exonuclease SbcCD subunit D C-terminal domain-containing protein [Clostridiales bacterium]|nr:exonuclease SbcCD subunit D C-terminal domain-containing protein [Clostridiales bacterium]